MGKRTGRPPKNGAGKGEAKIVAFRFTNDMVEQIDLWATKLCVTRTAIVEMGVNMAISYLKKNGDI